MIKRAVRKNNNCEELDISKGIYLFIISKSSNLSLEIIRVKNGIIVDIDNDSETPLRIIKIIKK